MKSAGRLPALRSKLWALPQVWRAFCRCRDGARHTRPKPAVTPTAGFLRALPTLDFRQPADVLACISGTSAPQSTLGVGPAGGE
jgi:hypothetical protein